MDADDRNASEKDSLQNLGISVLPVSEIENILLLPDVSKAIAQTEGYEETELENILQDLRNAVFAGLNTPQKIEAVLVRYCRRRIDRHLKKIDLSEENTVEGITNGFNQKTIDLDISAIASQASSKIQASIDNNDISSLLEIYDDKSLVSLVAAKLKHQRQRDFESWLTRMLRKQEASNLVNVIQGILPEVEAP